LATLKQHCQLAGDVFFVYELTNNSLLEYSEHFEHLTGFKPNQQFEQQCQQHFVNKLSSITPISQQPNTCVDYQVKHQQDSVWLSCVCYEHVDNENNSHLLFCSLKNVNHQYCHHYASAKWQEVGHNQLGYLQQHLMDLYQQTDVDHAFLIQPTSALHKEAKTIVAISYHKFVDQVSYTLADTPCKNTMLGSICTYEQDVQTLFPNDCLLKEAQAQSYLGMPFFDQSGRVNMILVLLSCKPLTNKEQLIGLVQDFQPKFTRHIQLLESELLLTTINKSSLLQRDSNAEFKDEPIGGLLDNGVISPLMKSLPNFKWAEIFEVIYKSTTEAIVITDKSSKIISVNDSFTQITGYQEHEAIGNNPSMLSSGRNDGGFYKKVYGALHEHGHWQGEIRNRKKNGKLYFEWLNIRVIHDDDGNVSHYIGIFSDISEHKSNQHKLYLQANFEPLTQLANRSFLFFHIAKALSATASTEQHVALIHIDINGMAKANERFGYQIGDEILRQTAQRLQALCIKDSLVSRISGDNFAILLKQSPSDHSLSQLTNKISNCITTPFEIEGHRINLKAGIGVATSQDPTLPAEKLLLMTEQALLKAKEQTQGHIFLFNKDFQDKLRIELQLEQDLAIALKDNQLELYYQPQIDAITGQVSGVEALVRWLHPTMGLLQPGQFIPLAEKTGQIVELGNVVLTKACSVLREWNLAGINDISMAVNISPRQFTLEHITHQLETIIEQSGVNPDLLVLEITEDVFLSDNVLLQTTLNRLKKTGIKLSLDDFGTGFSSLSYLQQYPLDVLKIDRAFVNAMSEKAETRMIVKAIIAMAKAMNLKVVAEGVETLDQVSVLQQYQCNIFQGFYYSKPLPEVALKDFIRKLNCASAKNDSISLEQIII
jgi:diguanylate cyclase (GGDEF)-like protein/PAS domain S-box-containing protein